MRNMLLSTATLFLVPAISYAAPDFIITHTYTTPIELESVSYADMGHTYKTAAICFLGSGDCDPNAGFSSGGRNDGGYQIDTAQQCRNEGYTVTSCSLPAYPSGQCPYNDGYFAKCVEDKPRACEETGFGETDCAAGTVIEATCSYDANYKKCKCDPCNGYDYTYEQATAQGYITDGSCQSCSETKYKRKENPCSGYSVCECGGEVGASTCYTGSTKKFSQCKACCSDVCTTGFKYKYSCGYGYRATAVGTTECGSTCYGDCTPCLTEVPKGQACMKPLAGDKGGCLSLCRAYYTGEYNIVSECSPLITRGFAYSVSGECIKSNGDHIPHFSDADKGYDWTEAECQAKLSAATATITAQTKAYCEERYNHIKSLSSYILN